MKSRLGLGALVLAACTRPQAPSPAPASPVAEAPVPAPVATESATPPAPTVDAPPDAASPPVSDPGSFTCGKLRCVSGTETCCEASTDTVCLPSSPDGPYGAIGFLSAQWQACDKAPFEHGYSLSGISRCDESIDCAASRICCEEFLFSGATVNLCAPAQASGRSPCEFGERCVDGSTCRVPGTVCRDGYCIKPVAEARCDAETCAEGESCCGEPLGCKPHAACDPRQPRIACTKPDDCVAGHRCLYSESSGSACTGHVDLVTPNWLEDRGLAIVCTRDADCPGKCPRGAKMRCKPATLPWLRACACP